MRKAFKLEAAISLLANENRITNGALSACYYLHFIHFLSAFLFIRKAFIPLKGNLHKNQTNKKEYFGNQWQDIDLLRWPEYRI